jgi:hypothetical protein
LKHLNLKLIKMIPVATKKVIIIVVTVAVATLLVGVAIAELASSPETAKDSDKVTNQTKPSFYEQAYAKATSEQKAELDKIIADNSIGLPGEWIRPVLIAIGDMPKDQHRLTAKQAEEIYDRIGGDEDTLANEFDKIAGAPDFIGGCGIVRSIYYLNDDRSESIHVMMNNAIHYAHNDNGTWTTLPLGNQQLHVNPSPSTALDGTPQTPPQPTLTDMPIPSPT